jgi:hydroxymethylpyrimidine pyrophosphatase-like HAD family hydrolase
MVVRKRKVAGSSRPRPSPSRGSVAALAVDFDRTLAPTDRGSLRAASAVLASVRRMGLRVLLVSGREYASLRTIGRRLRHVDGLVAENGAVVEVPLGTPPHVAGRAMGLEVRRRLTQIPDLRAEYGRVVASIPRAERRRAARRLRGLRVDLVPNVDRVMVLPKGVSKLSGTRLALRSLGLGSSRFAAIGDAENDLPLLRAAALSGAVGNAIPRVRSVVDYASRAPFHRGVAEFVRGPLAATLGGPRGRSSGPRAGRPDSRLDRALLPPTSRRGRTAARNPDVD